MGGQAKFVAYFLGASAGGQKEKETNELCIEIYVSKKESNKDITVAATATTTTINSRKILMIQIIWQEQKTKTKNNSKCGTEGSRKCFIIFFHINLLLAFHLPLPLSSFPSLPLCVRVCLFVLACLTCCT